MTERDGGPKRHAPNERHGLHTMKLALRELGSRAIDRRTRLGRALARWRAELIEDLGGADAQSTQELAVVDLAVKTKLMVDSVDAWLLQQRSLVNLRKRALLPVVLQRQQLADALARYMTQLGLKRRARPVLPLGAYLEERYGQDRSGGEAPGGARTEGGNTERAAPADERAPGGSHEPTQAEDHLPEVFRGA